jgi:integrase
MAPGALWPWQLLLSKRRRLLEKPSSETKRDRALDDRELRIVWTACDKIDWPYRNVVRLMILLGARRGEIVGMKWSELSPLDDANPVWTLPAARSKNRRAHIVPLAPAVVEILRDMPRFESDFVFPTHKGSSAVSNHASAKLRLDHAVAEINEAPLPEWRFHDLRHSFVSGLARIGIDMHVAERCVNHVSGSFGGIVGVYQHHNFEDQMKQAFFAWAEHIKPLGVVPMKRQS